MTGHRTTRRGRGQLSVFLVCCAVLTAAGLAVGQQPASNVGQGARIIPGVNGAASPVIRSIPIRRLSWR